MLDAITQRTLVNIVQREGHSLLLYVSEAFPWTTPEEQGALQQFQELALKEGAAVGELRKALARHHIFPPPGSFPMSFTTINFVSLEHLLPLLADEERRTLGELEKDASAVA